MAKKRKKNNKELFTILALLTGLFIVTFFFISQPEISETQEIDKNLNNCVPAECCHPKTCVDVGEKPICDDIYCTKECSPGTMDCGQGSCQRIEGKCQAVFN